MESKIRLYGHTWKINCGEYESIIDERFKIISWQFGSVYQVKIFINYPLNRGFHKGIVPICLKHKSTRNKAIRHGLDWIKSYKENGPLGPEALFKKSFEDFKLLYRTRISLLNSMFFYSSSYEWLDGAIIRTDPDDNGEINEENYFQKIEFIKKEYENNPNMMKMILEARKIAEEKEKNMPIGPIPDQGELFCPYLDYYSNIKHIPQDVRQDWLKLCVEAANILVTRGDPNHKYYTKNKEIGANILNQIKNRFKFDFLDVLDLVQGP